MPENLSSHLETNIKTIKAFFHESVDLYTKPVLLCNFSCCICMFEGLSSIERLWVMMLDALSREENKPKTPEALLRYILTQTAIPMENSVVMTLEEMRVRLTSGASVILIDGCDTAVVISTQSMQIRSVQEASGEGNVRGSREGFTEPLRVNISLVRRLVRTGALTVTTMTAGAKTKTELALLYDADLVPENILNPLKERIQSANLPFLFDVGYLAPFIQRGAFSLFQSVGYTERPDTAAAKICEGKVIVLANGSPFAMIVPYFFNENFQSMDDYSEKAYFASFIRLLKYAAFFIAVLLPGVFVSIATFTPELLPSELLYKVAASEQATPLPLFLEAVLVTILLEIVREAGLRLPKPIGHSVSLVSALILGDAAIGAGLLGAPIVVIAALTSICTFVVPALYEPIIVLRLSLILAGGLLGPIGICALLFCALCSACNLQLLGFVYTAPLAPMGKAFLRDGVLRRNWKVLADADFSVQDFKRKQQGKRL
ncbi:MAG: spore germination protein [Ruthenibacterium sp.]